MPPGPRPARGHGLLRWAGRIIGALGGLVVLGGLAGVLALYLAYRHYASDLPDVDGLLHYQPRVMSRVYASDGRLLEDLATERRIFVPYAQIPDQVKRAFLAAEDQNFWTHKGVDPMAILRAGLTDLAQMGKGRRPMGASTITQQVAKNMLLGNEVSLARKVKEAILAMRIEQVLSKERILELYLNEIYLGLGAYGVGAAAQAYFDKPLERVTLSEAAFLGALPKGPNNYNPFRFPEAARARRDWVLDRMVDDHDITRAQAEAAKAEPLVPTAPRRPEVVQDAGYFAEEVRRRLVDRFGADITTQGGLMVRTTLDPAMQALADRVLRAGLMKYDRAHGGWRGPVAHLGGGAALRRDWPAALEKVARPSGMLAEWQLAVVLRVGGSQAELGWLERRPDNPDAPATPRTGELGMADVAWARRAHDTWIGPPPRRMGDVVRTGDVVMVEPGGDGRPAGRLALRQIPEVEGAMVSLDPHTGRVLAMSGGWSYEMSQFNRASQGLRQPGSSFKPFVYLTAMEQGISPSQRFSDGPFVEDLGRAGQWRPMNYEQTFGGPVSLHVALEKSLNLVTVRVAKQVGMDAVAQTATAFHVVESMHKVLPAALGAVDTTVLRMAGGYASLEEGGREVEPTLIDSVQDRDGRVIWRAPGLSCPVCGDESGQMPALDDQRKQIADPASVFQVVTMMQDVVRHGTGFEAGKGLDRDIAGKTGTTQDFNDAWFAGFTPNLVTVVWVGFDQPDSLGEGETGGVLAAPIWHDFMAAALKDHPVLPFVPPEGVTLASWNAGGHMVTDAFKPGQEPGVSVALAARPKPGASGGEPAKVAEHSEDEPISGGGLDTTMGGLY